MTREDEEMQFAANCGRGRGRPKKDGSRSNTHTVRFDDEEEAMLEHLEVESDNSKSDIMRKALRMYYRYESKKW